MQTIRVKVTAPAEWRESVLPDLYRMVRRCDWFNVRFDWHDCEAEMPCFEVAGDDPQSEEGAVLRQLIVIGLARPRMPELLARAL